MSGTYLRTIKVEIPILSSKKSGMLKHAMRQYRQVREYIYSYFLEHDASEFGYGERESLRKEIINRDDITLHSRTIQYAISACLSGVKNYEQHGEEYPSAQSESVYGLARKATRIYYHDGRYYLNIHVPHGDLELPLDVSTDSYHTNRFPDGENLPMMKSKYQQRAGISFYNLEPDALPESTVSIRGSTITQESERQYRVNITFEIEKELKRDYDTDSARYVVGVDRGRNELAYACLYDREEDHVDDWYNRNGDEVAHFMERFAERIREFQQAHVWGKMEKARTQRYQYKQQIDYEIANSIVDLARNANRDDVVIMLENLTSGLSRSGGYEKERRRFNEWSFGRLGDVIEQKAEPYDIPVFRCEPRYTSQRCSRCGEESDIDRNGIHFECKNCSYSQHADANASVNIAKTIDMQ